MTAVGIGATALAGDGTLRALEKIASDAKPTEVMPVLFVGHGSPMNAIEQNRYSDTWIEIGKELPKPSAILSISAHWLTRNGTRVTAMEKPKTIHDFGGFPQDLFDVQYPAAGSPAIAKETQQLLGSRHVVLDDDWGFDHGTWSVLKKMYPNADIPTLQLSLDWSMPPAGHYELAKMLQALRSKGVLIMGSGNIVHNLRAIDFNGGSYDWAVEFDDFIAKNIVSGDDAAIVDFQKKGDLAKLAHPTYDHFLPLLYVLGAKDKKDKLRFFNEGVDLGSVSMRSVIYEQ